MKKRAITLLSIVPLLFACNEKEPVGPEFNKYSVDFSTVTTGFNNSNPDTFNTRLKNFMDVEGKYISSIRNVGYVQVSQLDMVGYNTTEEKYYEYVLHALIPCSGAQNGSVTFVFNNTCSKVKFTAQPYYKSFYIYGDDGKYISSSIDAVSILNVNNEEWDLSQNKPLGELPDIVEKEFEINANALTIEAYLSQRVFIHKLEFTFAK